MCLRSNRARHCVFSTTPGIPEWERKRDARERVHCRAQFCTVLCIVQQQQQQQQKPVCLLNGKNGKPTTAEWERERERKPSNRSHLSSGGNRADCQSSVALLHLRRALAAATTATVSAAGFQNRLHSQHTHTLVSGRDTQTHFWLLVVPCVAETLCAPSVQWSWSPSSSSSSSTSVWKKQWRVSGAWAPALPAVAVVPAPPAPLLVPSSFFPLSAFW